MENCLTVLAQRYKLFRCMSKYCAEFVSIAWLCQDHRRERWQVTYPRICQSAKHLTASVEEEITSLKELILGQSLF